MINSASLSVHLYFAEEPGMWKTTPKSVFDRKPITWGQTNARLPDIYFPLLAFFFYALFADDHFQHSWRTPLGGLRRGIPPQTFIKKRTIITSFVPNSRRTKRKYAPKVLQLEDPINKQKHKRTKRSHKQTKTHTKKGFEVCRGEEIGLCWKADVNIYTQCWCRVNRQEASVDRAQTISLGRKW